MITNYQQQMTQEISLITGISQHFIPFLFQSKKYIKTTSFDYSCDSLMAKSMRTLIYFPHMCLLSVSF